MTNLLKLLLLTAICNGLIWMVLTPPFQYPDEQSHFAQVQNLSEQNTYKNLGQNNTSLEINLTEEVLGTARDNLGNNSYTYHPEFKPRYSDTYVGPNEDLIRNLPENSRLHLVKKESTENPPLFYLLATPAYKLFSSSSLFERLFAVRFISLILFTLNVYVAYLVGKIIFGKHPSSLALPAAIASMPMLIHSSTGVLPDSLTNLLFSIVLYFSLKVISNGLNPSYLIYGVLTIWLGIYTRQQFPISIFILLMAITIAIFLKNKFKTILFICSATALLTVFFFFRIISIPEVHKLDLTILLSNEFIDHVISSLKLAYVQTLPWYWGVYKWLSLTPPHILFQVINRIIVISAVGLLIYYFSKYKKGWKMQDTLIVFLILSSSLYFLVLMIWEFYHIKTHGFPFGFQGRYYFPLVAAHMSLLIFGLTQFLTIFIKKNISYLYFTFTFMMIVFNDVSLAYLVSSYYDTTSISRFIIEASQYKPFYLKGNIIVVFAVLAVSAQSLFLTKYFKEIRNDIKSN